MPMVLEQRMTVSARDYSEKPALVFWETTRACLLACKHCRASALREPLPGELTTEEARVLIEQVASFGQPSPVMIITGGDPLMRRDLFSLLDYARERGVKFAVSPAVTELLSRETLGKLMDHGASSISVSLDGAAAVTHDGIRTVEGTFNRTLEVLRISQEVGLKVQVNTTVMKRNLLELPRIFHLIRGLGVRTWEVFFLIKVGRGAEMEDLTPEEYESVSNFLYDCSKYDVLVRTVEAPFIRRVAKMRDELGDYWRGYPYEELRRGLRDLDGEPRSTSTIGSSGTLDGDGIVFVAYDGTIQPGGFLPLPLGNIKDDNLVNVYRGNRYMRDIRHRDFSGYCGRCNYKWICGGSRSRSYYSSGSPLGTDQACLYPVMHR